MIGEYYGDTSSPLVTVMGGGTPTPLVYSTGSLFVTIPSDFTGSLMYYCTAHSSMQNAFTIMDSPDSGSSSPDSGYSSPDSGTSSPDSGTTSPDSGYTSPDGDTASPDSGTTSPDSGYTSPDSGSSSPDSSYLAVYPSTPHKSLILPTLPCRV